MDNFLAGPRGRGSAEPGGPVELPAPFVEHQRGVGLELTIYDPALDPDLVCAARMVALLETLLTL